MAWFIASTPAAGPSGWSQTALTTARKSAPARTRPAQFPGVMPPIATTGSSITSDHHSSRSGSARTSVCLVPLAKNAPNAT